MSAAHPRLKKIAVLSLAGVLFAGSFFSQRHLNQQREDLDLTRITPLENAPPMLAFTTVALGGFRGLIANVLWIRASELQENGKYFEMFQLSDWITKLQPHFSLVWANQAWNMSYNISIKFERPEDRWPWVRRGIELLRDEGLRYNPKEPLIYRELAWHFQHKMGQNLDDAHEYYKQVWAEEMQQVLGGGRPDYAELLNPTRPETVARVKTLREKYKLEPRRMQEVDNEYGPLEWRLPETHSIYWAYVGLQECAGAKREDLTQLRRNIFQSMQTAFLRGRMIFPVPDLFEFAYGPNIFIVDKVNKAYEDMIAGEPASNIQNGHKNFLKLAVFFLYTYNNLKAAEEWFQYLQRVYPDSLLTGEQLEEKRKNPRAVFPPKSLDEYAMERVIEETQDGGVDKTKAVIESYLQSGYEALAMGEEDRSVGFERYARLIWHNYMTRIGDKPAVRVGLPDYEVMKQEVLRGLLGPRGSLHPVLQNILRTALGLGPEAYSEAIPPGNPGPSQQGVNPPAN